jgi:hypothetical protein
MNVDWERYSVVLSFESQPISGRNVSQQLFVCFVLVYCLSYYSTLNVKATYSSETSVAPQDPLKEWLSFGIYTRTCMILTRQWLRDGVQFSVRSPNFLFARIARPVITSPLPEGSCTAGCMVSFVRVRNVSWMNVIHFWMKTLVCPSSPFVLVT